MKLHCKVIVILREIHVKDVHIFHMLTVPLQQNSQYLLHSRPVSSQYTITSGYNNTPHIMGNAIVLHDVILYFSESDGIIC